jgi:large conductance mechanosensitive channel
LAVAVVIGASFGAIVTALVKDLITPLIAAIVGKSDFSGLFFTINNSKFLYGDFLNGVVSFILIAAVIFFLIVQPLNKLQAIANSRKAPEDQTEKKCPECFNSVTLLATRCMYCTAKITVESK